MGEVKQTLETSRSVLSRRLLKLAKKPFANVLSNVLAPTFSLQRSLSLILPRSRVSVRAQVCVREREKWVRVYAKRDRARGCESTLERVSEWAWEGDGERERERERARERYR
ncbi:MAG: hypothetical protein ACTS4U_00710 [Candidatus Hodgkinia cicadicola]